MTGDVMEFPETFEEFAKAYSIVDRKEVYTNGSKLIPVFRVKQWLENTALRQKMVDRDALLKLTDEMDGEKRDISCSTCREYFGLACYDYKPNATCMEACLRYYARRIRWALGVDDADNRS